MNHQAVPPDDLSDTDRDLIAVVAECFEAAARREDPSIETHLALAPRPSVRRALLHELIPLDAEVRAARSEPPNIRSYLNRFPDDLTEATLAELLRDITVAVAPLGPDYEIVRELGSGSMGVVYLARQRGLGRQVALKRLTTHGRASSVLQSRFNAEALALAAVVHPNIVGVYDAGELPEGPYIAMEYCPGGSLADQLDRSAPVNPWDVAEAIRGLATGLHQAHELEILHRDIKPANILLDAEGRYKIADFGLAKRGDQTALLSRSGGSVGTPAYMAPEQFSGDYSRASDVYGLGAVLYHWLTGRPPFTGTVDQILSCCQNESPARPRALNRAIPRALEVICLTCLEKSPRDRYGSAHSLAEDLQRFLTGRTIMAKPSGPLECAAKWAKRNPTKATLVVLVLVAVTAVLWVNSARLREAEFAKERDAYATERAEGERRTAYYNALARADRAWLSASVKQADGFLDECPEDLRHWEWHFQKRRIQSDVLRLEAGSVRILQTAFSPDGRFLGAAAFDGTVRVWNAGEGKLLLTLPAHAGPVRALTFTSDGKRLATVGDDGTAKLWERESGRLLHILRGHVGLVWCAAFDPEGRYLATGGEDSTVRFWDVATGTGIGSARRHESPVRGLAFAKGGRLFAVGGNRETGELRIWNVGSEEEIHAPMFFTRPLLSVALSPDGLLALGSAASEPRYGQRSLIHVLDALTLQELRELRGSTGEVASVAFGPDSRQLVSGVGHVIQTWDAKTGVEGLRLHIDTDSDGAALSPDGRRVAAGYGDHTVRVWDATTEQGASTVRHQMTVNHVAFPPLGDRLVAIMSDGTFAIWNLADGRVLWRGTHPGSPRGTLSTAFSADGRWVATASGATAVKVWDADTGMELSSIPHTGVACISFRPDGRLVAGDHGGSVVIWNPDTREEQRRYRLGTDPVRALALSPDGRLLVAVGKTSGGRVWDCESGAEVTTFGRSAGELSGVAFSPDGRCVATAGNDATVRLWDATNGTELKTIRGHTAKVCSLSFTPDGHRLASASDDKTVKIWDTLTGQEVFTVQGRAAPACVVFSPNGHRLSSGGWDGAVRVWDATPVGRSNP